jgi:hypothetical protein
MYPGILADWESVAFKLVEAPPAGPVLTVEQFGKEVFLTYGKVLVVRTTARNIMAQFMSDALDTQERGRRR